MIIIPRILFKLCDCVVELDDRSNLETLIELGKKNLEYLLQKQIEIDILCSGDGADDSGLIEKSESRHHIIDPKTPQFNENSYHG